MREADKLDVDPTSAERVCIHYWQTSPSKADILSPDKPSAGRALIMASVLRPAISAMPGYTPGEQPQESGWIKLNTNENPYPPSPTVVDAIRQEASGPLNIYPDPGATEFRKAAAALYGVDPDWVLPANGSDENLTIITRAFCDADDRQGYPYPSYVLYETLAQIQGCPIERLLLDENWQWTPEDATRLRESCKVFFVPNPNSPSGTVWSPEQLLELLPNHGILVLDEAYGDFVEQPHRGELLHDPRFDGRLVITRTFSKSYSLAGIRFGFCLAHPDLVQGMNRVKDSYNCDAVAIAAATAAINDQPWMLNNTRKILATRSRLAEQLTTLGFHVCPGQANFIWVTHPSGEHRGIYEQLKQRRILIRLMTFPHSGGDRRGLEGLRITIGTDQQVQVLVDALKQILD